MSGGLLALSKQWWDELSGYDDQMEGWGGENIDQSLRIWLWCVVCCLTFCCLVCA